MSESEQQKVWRGPRPLRAAAVSVLLPGSGHWWVGRRRRALVIGGVSFVGLIGALWLASRSAYDLLEWFVQPAWLWLVFWGNVAVAALRMFASFDAYRLAPEVKPPPSRWPVRAGLAAIALLIALPHVFVGVYAIEAIDLIETVFVDDTVPPLAEREQELLALGVDPTDLGPSAPRETTTTMSPPATFTPRSGLSSAEGKELIPESDLNPYRPELAVREANFANAPFESITDRYGDERITVLLAGGDAGPGRWSMRTDVMIVASLNLETGKAALFSLSRDLVEAPLPWWGEFFEDEEFERAVRSAKKLGEDPPDRETFEPCNCFPNRLNAIWTYTNAWVRTFPDAPDPGMEALRQTVSMMMGLDIQYYVLVDMAGFVDLVDSLGGIDLYVAEAMDVGFSPANEGEDPVVVTIEDPGRYHFDGRTALAYVRNRTGSSDYTRMERQRCMIRSLADELDPGNVIARFPAIADAIKNSTTTNLPLSFVPDLIRAAASLDADSIATVAFASGYYAEERDAWGLPIIEADRIRGKVWSVLNQIDDGSADAEPLANQCDPPEAG